MAQTARAGIAEGVMACSWARRDASDQTFPDRSEPNCTMWPTIERARRLLGGVSAPARPSEVDATTPAGAQRPVEDVVIILGSVEVDRLRAALERELGDAVERPDTPARIEHALLLFLAHRGAAGKPSVLRRPAGLSTPESWEIHLDGVDRATSRAVRAAGRSGSFA